MMKCDIRDFGATRLAENLMDNFTLTHLNLSWWVFFLIDRKKMRLCSDIDCNTLQLILVISLLVQSTVQHSEI